MGSIIGLLTLRNSQLACSHSAISHLASGILAESRHATITRCQPWSKAKFHNSRARWRPRVLQTYTCQRFVSRTALLTGNLHLVICNLQIQSPSMDHKYCGPLSRRLIPTSPESRDAHTQQVVNCLLLRLHILWAVGWFFGPEQNFSAAFKAPAILQNFRMRFVALAAVGVGAVLLRCPNDEAGNALEFVFAASQALKGPRQYSGCMFLSATVSCTSNRPQDHIGSCLGPIVRRHGSTFHVSKLQNPMTYLEPSCLSVLKVCLG